MIYEIVLDTETTGLSRQTDGGDRLVEIGCIELRDGIPSGRHYQQYINPRKRVHSEALRVHGLDNNFLADKPIFADIADEFLKFIGNAVLVIHNAPFDMGFINLELQLSGRKPLDMARTIDTIALARQKFPHVSSHKLDSLCVYLGVDNSNRKMHGALQDAQLLAEVYAHMRNYAPPLNLV